MSPLKIAGATDGRDLSPIVADEDATSGDVFSLNKYTSFFSFFFFVNDSLTCQLCFSLKDKGKARATSVIAIDNEQTDKPLSSEKDRLSAEEQANLS